MPMQQTPSSKPLSTDQSPAPLMPTQLPLHSLHDPQASLVSAPQQVSWQALMCCWGTQCRGQAGRLLAVLQTCFLAWVFVPQWL